MIKLRLDSGRLIYLNAAHVVAVTEGHNDEHCMVHTDDGCGGWYVFAAAETVSQLVDSERVVFP